MKKLSYTSRPALLTALFLSVLLMLGAMYGWYAIGPEIRRQVTWAQGGTLLAVILLLVAIMLALGYSRMWADEDEVVVRNGLRIRHYPISEVAGVRLRKGDPWAYLLIKDGEVAKPHAVLAIQQLEGNEARRKVRDLKSHLKAAGATSKGVRVDD